MVAGVPLAQIREDRLERAAPDLALAGAGEHPRPLPVALDQPLALELVEEGFEVERRIEIALLLQVPHPAHRLLGIAPGGEHQMVPDPHQVEPGQDRTQQVGIEVEVTVPHRCTLRKRRVVAPDSRGSCQDSRKQSTLEAFTEGR